MVFYMLTKEKRSMLVIDDDASILRTFSRIFEKNGYNVATAKTGKEAQEKLERSGFDATLLDLRLSDMSGIDLLQKIHKTAPKMVKIVLTGMPNDENISQASAKGADIFLAKPVRPELLLALLEEKLNNKRKHNS
jgi:DNA-binding NtrC family response regulator